jgi:hypothetical protein
MQLPPVSQPNDAGQLFGHFAQENTPSRCWHARLIPSLHAAIWLPQKHPVAIMKQPI